ncbi:uncharacterized protein LOC130406521 [Gadus chalcogrammus]|uniref:uncharacterized protein LOC130406521 n=1 Tax=Gadus chalcogrammus TaxID=1042646 RepID=UPI0024C48E31|nr:uncharacterized protein LOC130406521 [Gadus chalcogrammus]
MHTETRALEPRGHAHDAARNTNANISHCTFSRKMPVNSAKNRGSLPSHYTCMDPRHTATSETRCNFLSLIHAHCRDPNEECIAVVQPGGDKGMNELLCISQGGWNNNLTAGEFQGIFHKLIMYRCGVKPVDSGNVRGQDATVTLSAEHYTRVSLSAAEMSSADAATAVELVSPFLNISALVGNHSYLPTRFGALVDNALVYIAGFVVRCIFRSLSCVVCCSSLVTDTVAVPFDQSYHLLELRNNGGLMIPSKGTVKGKPLM